MLQQPGVAPKIVGRADPHRHAAIVPEHLLVPDVGFWVLKDLKASRTVNLCWCMCFVGGVGLKLSSCFWMVWYWFGVWLCSRLNRDCFAHIPYRLSHFEHVGGLPCVCVEWPRSSFHDINIYWEARHLCVTTGCPKGLFKMESRWPPTVGYSWTMLEHIRQYNHLTGTPLVGFLIKL
jgi:hypothetical protein